MLFIQGLGGHAGKGVWDYSGDSKLTPVVTAPILVPRPQMLPMKFSRSSLTMPSDSKTDLLPVGDHFKSILRE